MGSSSRVNDGVLVETVDVTVWLIIVLGSLYDHVFSFDIFFFVAELYLVLLLVGEFKDDFCFVGSTRS